MVENVQLIFCFTSWTVNATMLCLIISHDMFFLHIRSIRKSEEDIPVPPLVKSAALWGMLDSSITILFRAIKLILWYALQKSSGYEKLIKLISSLYNWLEFIHVRCGLKSENFTPYFSKVILCCILVYEWLLKLFNMELTLRGMGEWDWASNQT